MSDVKLCYSYTAILETIDLCADKSSRAQLKKKTDELFVFSYILNKYL